MISYWEKDALSSCDILIAGGGILGLSVAIELKEKAPALDILLLERGIFPSGASTKNAGFACFAKAAEMLSDIKKSTPEAVVELAYKRYLGLEKLRKRLGDEAIEFFQLGGHELLRENDALSDEKIRELNELLLPYFSMPVFQVRNELISRYGFKGISQLIYTPLEGQIHSGKMIKALWQMAARMGVRILTGAELNGHEESGSMIRGYVHHRWMKEDIEIQAEKLVFCTNALSTRLYPELGIHPGRGQVLITEPIQGLKFKGTFHFDEGFYYFRNHGERVLFGGGRNLDFDTENTSDFEYNQAIQEKLDHYLEELILPGQKVKIDMRWTGIMGFNAVKEPVVKAYSPRSFVGFTCNGMGIALGSYTAEKLARLILSADV
jgi:glycine/D-amino acid oxidase-like deaminating enzyme